MPLIDCCGMPMTPAIRSPTAVTRLAECLAGHAKGTDSNV